MEDCIFCKIVADEISSTKFFDSDNFIAILDANPVSEGHTLIISKKHFKTMLDMPNSLGVELIEVVKKISLELIESGKAEGFNFVANNFEVSGQEVPHLHFHIIPRKKDDGLKMRFER